MALEMLGLAQTVENLHDLAEWAGDGTTARVRAGEDYALYVEFGTVHMQAQPYIRPAIQRAASNDLSRIIAESDSADEVVERFANAVADYARQMVPVDTGALRDSIHVEVVER